MFHMQPMHTCTRNPNLGRIIPCSSLEQDSPPHKDILMALFYYTMSCRRACKLGHTGMVYSQLGSPPFLKISNEEWNLVCTPVQAYPFKSKAFKNKINKQHSHLVQGHRVLGSHDHSTDSCSDIVFDTATGSCLIHNKEMLQDGRVVAVVEKKQWCE